MEWFKASACLRSSQHEKARRSDCNAAFLSFPERQKISSQMNFLKSFISSAQHTLGRQHSWLQLMTRSLQKLLSVFFFRPLNLIKQLSVNIAVMVSGWGLHCPNSSPSCCFDTPNGADVRNKPAPAILCLETTTVTQTPLGNDHLYHLVHIKMFCYSDRFLGLRTGGISVQLLGNGVRGRQQWKADIWVGWREAVRVKQPEKESEPGCETVL